MHCGGRRFDPCQLHYMSKKQILEEVDRYIDYLEKPSDNFGGMPVCPFVKAERQNNKIMIETWNPSEESYLDVLEKFKESDYVSALIVCENTEGVDWKDVDRKEFQKKLQRLMKEKGHDNLKALCLSPFEEFTAAGEETRKGTPYFLINIVDNVDMAKAHKTLVETKYFDKFSKEEINELKVYPKNYKK